MALPEPDGHPQHEKEVQEQYAYAVIMPQPTAEHIAEMQVKEPSDFDRPTFRELVVKCHEECGVTLIETACFREPHANGKIRPSKLRSAK